MRLHGGLGVGVPLGGLGVAVVLGVAVAVALGVGVLPRGVGVAVTTGVAVGSTVGVEVGGTGVAVAGTGVAVGGTCVLVGAGLGSEVEDGAGVALGTEVALAIMTGVLLGSMPGPGTTMVGTAVFSAIAVGCFVGGTGVFVGSGVGVSVGVNVGVGVFAMVEKVSVIVSLPSLVFPITLSPILAASTSTL
jgi:hypothetical protein